MSLKGLSEDGTHLIVATTDGDEHRLLISDELRDLVRHARVMRRDADEPATHMSPREIQQRIRAGLNAAELAELTGETVAAIRKFEPPVLAERAYIVHLARNTRIGRDKTAPTLGDLVGDRLAGRGVDPAEVDWDAWREVDEPWKVAADYRVDGRSVRALWTFDHLVKALTAEDEESQWLTETELLDAPVPQRHLSAVRTETQPVPLHPRRPVNPASAVSADVLDGDDASHTHTTDALLEDLASRRGTRESLDIEADDDEEFEGFGPTRAGAPGGPSRMPHPAGSASPATAEPRQPETSATPSPHTSTDKRPRKGRASVPSWDEIVFGAKND